MAISMGAALLGSAVLGIGGSILGANSTNRATQAASDASTRTAEMNNALYREVYGQNREMMQPFVSRGNAAGNQLNAMLGLGGAPSQIIGPQPLGPDAPGQWAGAGTPMAPQGGGLGEAHYYPANANQRHLAPDKAIMGDAVFTAPGAPATGTPQAANAADPFRQYIANSDYGFQFGEGANALNHGLASAGSINSGAAMKAMERFRQNTQAGYRNEYMGYLGQQQGVGLSGASALAGVGQNYAQMTGQNNQNAGDNAANALLMRGAANSNMWNGIAGSLGNALGSSYAIWGK